MKERSRPTSSDVARRAGVSRTTVSFVLNKADDKRISDETRQRVLQAAEELQYVPNASAKSLVTGRSRTLALYIRHHAMLGVDYYLTKLLEGLSLATNERGYRLLIESQDLAEPAKVLEMTVAGEIDGLMIVDLVDADWMVKALIDHGFPLVSIGTPFDNPEWSYSTDFRAYLKLVRHFAERGYDDVGYIHFAPHSGDSLPTRGKSLQDAVTAVMPDGRVRFLAEGGFDPQSGFDAMQSVLKRGERLPRALAVGNDTVAIGVIASLVDAGYRIPEDIAVAGFDDTPAARYLRPSLTTLRQDIPAVARASASLLLARLDGKEEELKPDVYDHELIIRQST